MTEFPYIRSPTLATSISFDVTVTDLFLFTIQTWKTKFHHELRFDHNFPYSKDLADNRRSHFWFDIIGATSTWVLHSWWRVLGSRVFSTWYFVSMGAWCVEREVPWSALGSSSCLNIPWDSGVWIRTAADKFDTAALGFGTRDQSAHLPVFLHLRTTNLPGPDSIMPNEHAQQRRMERKHHKLDRTRRRRTWSRPCPSTSCECLPFTPSAGARDSFASPKCLPTALTHGRVASSLSVSVCLCLSVCVCVVSPVSVSVCVSVCPSIRLCLRIGAVLLCLRWNACDLDFQRVAWLHNLCKMGAQPKRYSDVVVA